MSERQRRALKAYKEAKAAAERNIPRTTNWDLRDYWRAAAAAWGALAEAEELALKEAEG